MLSPAILDQAAALLDLFRSRGLRLATAESCTGGLIAACLTHVPGSSDVVDRGFISYSNAAKTDLVDVPREVIEQHGAVSQPVAAAMAAGALARSLADVTVSVTGVAGPGGGSMEKPVGLVWFGSARRGGSVITASRTFPGDRGAVREATVAFAFELLRQAAESGPK